MLRIYLNIITAFGIFTLLTACSVGEMMIDEIKSPYVFDKTVSTVIEITKANGWVIPKVYDFQKSLIKHGQRDPGKIKIIKLCHPEIAGLLLHNDGNKFMSVMMPCSISIHEKSDGSVYVASMNMDLMGKMFTGDVGKALSKVAEEHALIMGSLIE